MEREAHSTWLCTAPLSLQHCRENPCQNIPTPRPGNPFFFFKFLKKYQFTDLKQGVPWGGGLCVGCLWGWGAAVPCYPVGPGDPWGSAKSIARLGQRGEASVPSPGPCGVQCAEMWWTP